MKTSDQVQSGSAMLPRNRYKFRILDAKFGESKSSGKPMITLENEILEPTHIKAIDGEEMEVAGIKYNLYIPLTSKRIGAIREFFGKMGCMDLAKTILCDDDIERMKPEQPSIDVWPPRLGSLHGLVGDIILSSSPRRQVDDNNEPILDDDGKEIFLGSQVNAQMENVIGLTKLKAATVEYWANKPKF